MNTLKIVFPNTHHSVCFKSYNNFCILGCSKETFGTASKFLPGNSLKIVLWNLGSIIITKDDGSIITRHNSITANATGLILYHYISFQLDWCFSTFEGHTMHIFLNLSFVFVVGAYKWIIYIFCIHIDWQRCLLHYSLQTLLIHELKFAWLGHALQ